MTDTNKKFTHGIIAYEKVEGALYILHFCGYWEKPTDIEYQALKEELNADQEFNLIGRIDKDVFLMEASPQMIDVYWDMMQDLKNDTTQSKIHS
jgi:hypothetical protein